ncbi:hypothetical protein JR316_0002611 [Psilocybe cubensis]|uniref:Uncharacterized protein n=1 Tax=Psilocybe cubensis TaxID=181762 RepID=A0ACB8HDE3_PSICU|nr:hypothetical protein JR316_0002611 [Psilocybe cubensis]KAH9485699.1 hypothetical protein JR316_0002611 [Psilocybe cubensis]
MEQQVHASSQSRLSTILEPQGTLTPSKIANVPPSYRLLYRGALSLPDSLLVLDGLTFAARLDSPSKQSTSHLLENPLALALESMRGRPTLRLMGTIALKDVYMDESGKVEMDIHPLATLSQIYFENMFCLQPFSSASTSKDPLPERSVIGVKVALGDSNGPETTQVVIFAQVSRFSDEKKVIRLQVGRIAPRPLPQHSLPRPPRPDDPIPRKPPAFFIRDLKRGGSLGNLKRVASGSTVGGGPLKRQKTAGIAADLGSGVRLGAVDVEGDRVFKVPELPKQVKPTAKGKEKERDVFGDVSEVQRATVVKGKTKSDDTQNEAAFEKANKNAIKKSTTEYLARTKDPTGFIVKSHPDFKELFNFVYRGVCFALRVKMRSCTVDAALINRLIDVHAVMYLGGHGGSADGQGT